MPSLSSGSITTGKILTVPGRRQPRRAFTLVELLVVISIIALLIAILLPSLSKAREQAKTVVCATRIKGILSAMSVYATDNRDFVAGSPSTSGSIILGPTASDPAGMDEAWKWNPIQVWDWGGGLASSMSIRFSTKTHEQRYIDTVKAKQFTCPTNKILAVPYDDGPDYGNQLMPSYNTSRNFMWPGRQSLLSSSFPSGIDGFTGDPYWHVQGCGWNWDRDARGRPTPSGWAEVSNESYLPRVDMVGTPAEKVFIADGGRFVPDTDAPDYDARPWAPWGGAFADVGPYTTYSRAWDRIGGLPEGGAGPLEINYNDARIYSYRHGKKEPYLPVGNYKMNVGFFDTHVETMNDISSANPHMWLPRGFQLNVDNELHSDVIEKYMQVLESGTGRQYITIR